MSGRPPGSPRRRRRPDALALLGTAGATLALAGAAWYWYNQWTGSSASNDGDNATKGESSTSGRALGNNTQVLAKRPTLSLLLGPSLSLRSPVVRDQVRNIYISLSELYSIHLLCHLSGDDDAVDEELIANLGLEAGGIMDSRTVLPYADTTLKGARAAARALGCDAHVEVVVQRSKNTRSRSNVSESAQSIDLSATTQQHQLIRRNGHCKLFILWILPSPSPSQSDSETPALDEWSTAMDWEDAQIDSLVQSILNPAPSKPIRHAANGSASASVSATGAGAAGGGATIRILDFRPSSSVSSTGATDFDEAIKKGIDRLRDFRTGWR